MSGSRVGPQTRSTRPRSPTGSRPSEEMKPATRAPIGSSRTVSLPSRISKVGAWYSPRSCSIISVSDRRVLSTPSPTAGPSHASTCSKNVSRARSHSRFCCSQCSSTVLGRPFSLSIRSRMVMGVSLRLCTKLARPWAGETLRPLDRRGERDVCSGARERPHGRDRTARSGQPFGGCRAEPPPSSEALFFWALAGAARAREYSAGTCAR
jgi:hypothetical protein